LHRAFGFAPVGTYRRIGFKFGAWHDVAWTQLELVDSDDPPRRSPAHQQAVELERPQPLGPADARQ
jgi:hypothetical protein